MYQLWGLQHFPKENHHFKQSKSIFIFSCKSLHIFYNLLGFTHITFSMNVEVNSSKLLTYNFPNFLLWPVIFINVLSGISHFS